MHVSVSTVSLESRRRWQLPVEQELQVSVNHVTWFMGCWELNSGPEQEQEELLPAVLCVQPRDVFG